jgi:hypothetical protein
MPNGTAGCRMGMPNAEWECRMPNGNAGCRMGMPDGEWEYRMPTGNAECRARMPNTDCQNRITQSCALMSPIRQSSIHSTSDIRHSTFAFDIRHSTFDVRIQHPTSDIRIRHSHSTFPFDIRHSHSSFPRSHSTFGNLKFGTRHPAICSRRATHRPRSSPSFFFCRSSMSAMC